MVELKEAIAACDKASKGKGKGGIKGGSSKSIKQADKLKKPYLLLESVSRCKEAKMAMPRFVPMCSRIQANLIDELVTERSLKIANRNVAEKKMKAWIKSASNSTDKSHAFSVKGRTKNTRAEFGK